MRFTCGEIVTRTVTPLTGAQWIWHSAYHRMEDNGDLRIFVGLASEGEDHPKDTADIEAHIVAAASELLGRGQLRRWMKLRAARARSPLSRVTASGDISIDTAALPISPELAADVTAWATDYEQTFGDNAEDSGFDSQSQAVAFTEQGRSLVRFLQEELEPDWHVEYMPEPIKPPGLRLRSRR